MLLFVRALVASHGHTTKANTFAFRLERLHKLLQVVLCCWGHFSW